MAIEDLGNLVELEEPQQKNNSILQTREYLVESVNDSVYFCPICHRKIGFPFKGKINIKGCINLNCGYCKKGQVKIKIKEEPKEVVNA